MNGFRLRAFIINNILSILLRGGMLLFCPSRTRSRLLSRPQHLSLARVPAATFDNALALFGPLGKEASGCFGVPLQWVFVADSSPPRFAGVLSPGRWLPVGLGQVLPVVVAVGSDLLGRRFDFFD